MTSRLGCCEEVHGGAEIADLEFSIRGVRVSIYARPASHDPRGGDVYFLSCCRPTGIVKAVLADIAGHGVAAGEVAGELNAVFVQEQHEMSPGAFLAAMNGLWAKRAPPFVTAVALFMDARSGSVRWAVAGHPPPLFLPVQEGARHQHEGPPLGVAPDATFVEHDVVSTDCSRIVLYTDGLLEPLMRAGVRDPVRTLARHFEAQRDLRSLLELVETDDDATIMVVDCPGATTQHAHT